MIDENMICVIVEENKTFVSLHFPAFLFEFFANLKEIGRVELKCED